MPRSIDVLIVTALEDELTALRHVQDAHGAPWLRQQDSHGYDYFQRSFLRTNHSQFSVGAACVGMGVIDATNATTRLVCDLRPFCLAMCGVCAGDRRRVSLGDIIVADRLFNAVQGKLLIERDSQHQRQETFWPDFRTYNLDPIWAQKARRFGRDWADQRQTVRPTLTPFPAFSGTSHTRISGGPVVVHVGPLATVPQVTVDPDIFDHLRRLNRNILGLEMEGAAIGHVAYAHRIPWMIVAKGVQDYAITKDDSFRASAATASADFLIAFLQTCLPHKDSPVASSERISSAGEDSAHPADSIVRPEKILSNSQPREWKYQDACYFYTHDEALRIRRCAERYSRPCGEDWVRRFTSHEAFRITFELYYNDVLLQEYPFVEVDGGRMLIPLPDDSRQPTITQEQHRLALIVNFPNAGRNLDEYLSRASIRIVC